MTALPARVDMGSRAPVTLLLLSLLGPLPLFAQSEPGFACENPVTGVYVRDEVLLGDRVRWFDESGIDLTEPSFILLDRAPTHLLNPGEVRAEMERRYRITLDQFTEIEGRVVVGLRIDRNGRVTDRLVVMSSGEAALDSLAVQLSEDLEFTPPTGPDGCPMSAWVTRFYDFKMR